MTDLPTAVIEFEHGELQVVAKGVANKKGIQVQRVDIHARPTRTAPMHISASDVRDIPYRKIIELLKTELHSVENLPDEWQKDKQPRAGTTKFYNWVAAFYHWCEKNGWDPVRTITMTCEVHRDTVKDWVKRCRDTGRLAAYNESAS